MATDYNAIITAIDDAITSWAGKPITLTQSGRVITYRSLDELVRARRYYAKLAANQKNSKPFKISILKTGNAR